MGRGQWGNELECQGMSKTNDKGRGCKDRRFTTGRRMGNALFWGRDINSSACSEKRIVTVHTGVNSNLFATLHLYRIVLG